MEQVKLTELLETLEQSTLKELQEGVSAKDSKRFTAAYAEVLTSCQGCHVASEKSFLRLRVPERAPEALLQFEPK